MDQCLAGRATAKSASLNNRVKNKRATYAIVAETLKCDNRCCSDTFLKSHISLVSQDRPVLDGIIAKVEGFPSPNEELTQGLIYALVYDLLIGSGLKAGGKMVR